MPPLDPSPAKRKKPHSSSTAQSKQQKDTQNKYDPEQARTVLKVQREMAEENARQQRSAEAQRQRTAAAAAEEADSDSDSNDSDDTGNDIVRGFQLNGDDADGYKEAATADSSSSSARMNSEQSSVDANGTHATTDSVPSKDSSVTLEGLRQKLHARIAELTPNRKASTDDKHQKRVEEKKAKSKRKGEALKKQNKRQKLDGSTANGNDADSLKEKDSVTERVTGGQMQQRGIEGNSTTQSKSAKKDTKQHKGEKLNGAQAHPSADMSDVMYGSVRFDETPKVSHALQGELQRSGKLYNRPSTKQALKEIESFEQKVTELKEAGKHDEAAQLISQKSLDAALLRAQGIAVKDDKRILAKALKAKESKHKASAAQWADRKKAIKADQAAKQATKAENIEKRRMNSKKAQRAKSRPGFEGGAGKFIN